MPKFPSDCVIGGMIQSHPLSALLMKILFFGVLTDNEDNTLVLHPVRNIVYVYRDFCYTPLKTVLEDADMPRYVVILTDDEIQERCIRRFSQYDCRHCKTLCYGRHGNCPQQKKAGKPLP